jgi:hypothetical protein
MPNITTSIGKALVKDGWVHRYSAEHHGDAVANYLLGKFLTLQFEVSTHRDGWNILLRLAVTDVELEVKVGPQLDRTAWLYLWLDQSMVSIEKDTRESSDDVINRIVGRIAEKASNALEYFGSHVEECLREPARYCEVVAMRIAYFGRRGDAIELANWIEAARPYYDKMDLPGLLASIPSKFEAGTIGLLSDGPKTTNERW